MNVVDKEDERRKKEREKRSKNFSAFTIDKLGNGNEIMMVVFVIISFASLLREFIICHSSYMREKGGRGREKRQRILTKFIIRLQNNASFFFHLLKLLNFIAIGCVREQKNRERWSDDAVKKERKMCTCEKKQK